MSQDGLNALAMLSVEKELVRETPDFNHRVIEKFACLKDRRAKLTYKNNFISLLIIIVNIYCLLTEALLA